MPAFTTRAATPDDAEAVAVLIDRAFRSQRALFPEALEADTAAGFSVLLQTGHAFLLAEAGESLAGAVRHRDDEGIVYFDLLAAAIVGAGRELTRAVDRLAQDRGIRLVRTRIPETGRLADIFARWGYLPIARRPAKEGDGLTQLELEKRVPLLTVRDQRRADADAIARLAGIDPWPFTQGVRPGWFVLADGDRVAGVISVRDGGDGTAEITSPCISRGYGGRGLDAWMLERAATYAETNGYHSARTAATESFVAQSRTMEERRWFREGDTFIRRFRDLKPASEAEDDDW
jgi:predicted GNAT family acetyltransferase